MILNLFERLLRNLLNRLDHHVGQNKQEIDGNASLLLTEGFPRSRHMGNDTSWPYCPDVLLADTFTSYSVSSNQLHRKIESQ